VGEDGIDYQDKFIQTIQAFFCGGIMGRPIKHGVDYFSLEVTPAVDDRLEAVVSICGGMAMSLYITIIRAIYAKGYYTPWREVDRATVYRKGAFYFEDRALTHRELDKIVEQMVAQEIFHAEMYSHNILTSEKIQKEWLDIVRRRAEIKVNKDYLLVSRDWIDRHLPCRWNGLIWVTNGKH
jgi:hypothetical protein